MLDREKVLEWIENNAFDYHYQGGRPPRLVIMSNDLKQSITNGDFDVKEEK